MALSTGTSSGTQGSTQSPQTAVQPSNFSSGTPTSSVQPVVLGSQLNSTTGGIQLQNTQLSTVSLSNTTSTTAQATVAPKADHHTNPVLFGLAIVLFLLAIAMFWYTSHSSKNTTN